ncbi:MAG: hypothetical protein U0441_20730 [Polyangiaceae bacterium]
MEQSPKEAAFLIPMPGGRVARVPVSLLESLIDPAARSAHGPDAGVDDVQVHSASIDPTTGASVWHTDWELGQCDYTDEAGFPQSAYVWHRHPLGTEYTEIYQK